MNNGASEINTINRVSMAGTAMVARVVLGSAVFFVKCSCEVVKNFFAAAAGSESIRGKEKLTRLLKSGASLEVYTFTKEQFKAFAKQANRYGIVYSVVRRDAEDKADGTYDVMVKRSDAGKLTRVLDKIGYSTAKPVGNAEPVSEEKNNNKEPDGVTVTPEESRELVSLMLQPDERQRDSSQNPDYSAEGEPLSADISPEKRTSVNERMEKIRSDIKQNEASENGDQLVGQMLSGYDKENDDENINLNLNQESELMGDFSGKEDAL